MAAGRRIILRLPPAPRGPDLAKNELVAPLIERGYQEGFRQGFEEGLQQVREELLVRRWKSGVVRQLLTDRFGPLPRWAQQRIDRYTSAQFDAIAPSLVFGQTLKECLSPRRALRSPAAR